MTILNLALLLTIAMFGWLLMTGRLVPRRREQLEATDPPVDDDDSLVTYDSVARSLPARILEEIQSTGQCVRSDVGQHLWDEESIELSTFGSSKHEVRRWWSCSYCGVTTSTNPIPLEQRIPPGGEWVSRPDIDDLVARVERVNARIRGQL